MQKIALCLLFLFLASCAAIGLHPMYPDKEYKLEGKKALIICTSADTLLPSEKKTGVFASEMSVPYYEFTKAGIEVDLASINGGIIPIDPLSIAWYVQTEADMKMKSDKILQDKLHNSLKIADLDFTNYDIIYLAGGWGASYDLGYSEILGQKISEANNKHKIIGGICHGPLGLIRAKKANGEPLLKDKRVTAVTNKQINELGIDITPMRPETEIKKLGAIFEAQTAFRDIFANHIAEDDNLITGQNQNSGKAVAQLMMEQLWVSLN